MSTPVYDKAYFIAKFTAIPDELWTVGPGTEGGPTCAFGHCSGRDTLNEGNRLAMLLLRTAQINDGFNLRYKQPTPKARILAALADLP